MNCLWIILLLFGCGNGRSRNSGCGCSRVMDRGCDCANDGGCSCGNDCGCNEDSVRRVRRDLDYDAKSTRYPNISRSSETCGCEKADHTEL